jgi:hypothetical protein
LRLQAAAATAAAAAVILVNKLQVYFALAFAAV